MRIAYADIEANGKEIRNVTKVHCVVIIDDDGVHEYRPGDIDAACRKLETYDVVAWHNGIFYDIPVLKKLHKYKSGRVWDTLLVSRIMYPDHTQNPMNGHSLAHWGESLDEPKAEYTGGWDEFNEEMLRYCVQDVKVLAKIVKAQRPFVTKFPTAVKLEHKVAEFIAWQCRNGVGFRRERAETLMRRLHLITDAIENDMQELFPPRIEQMKSPAYWRGYNVERAEWCKYPTKKEAVADGCPPGKCEQSEERRTKSHPFNPGSRQQIADRLIEKYNWKPKKFTDGGKPQIDESVLSKLDYPEAQLLDRYLRIGKRISMIQSWLDADENGIIYGSVITNGTITGRMSHSSPNLGQVPSAEKPLGKACRACFGPTRPGWFQLGGDLSGLELRMLANRLWPWDDGAYAEIVLNGDPHINTMNIVNLALPADKQIERYEAKAIMYAVIYGAGPGKIGKMTKTNAVTGGKVLDRLKKGIKGLGELIEWVKRCVKRDGYVRGLDGRPLPIRSEHSALNTVLQSDGAVIGKLAWVLWGSYITKAPLRGRVYPIVNVHDEQQAECESHQYAVKAGEQLIKYMAEAGRKLNVKLPITGEYKVGRTWAQCH